MILGCTGLIPKAMLLLVSTAYISLISYAIIDEHYLVIIGQIALIWGILIYYKLSKTFIVISLFIFLLYVPAQTAPGGLLAGVIILRWSFYFILPALIMLELLPKWHKRQFRFRKEFLIGFMLLVIEIVLSGIIRQYSLMSVVSTILLFLSFPALFFVFESLPDIKEITRKVFLAVLILVLVQIPEVAIRYFIFGYRGDSVSFTLGEFGTYPLGILAVISIVFVMAHGLIKRLTFKHVICIGLLFCLAPLGEIKSIYYSSGILIVVLFTAHFYATRGHHNIRLYFKMLFVFLLFILALFFIYLFWSKFSFNVDFIRVLNLLPFVELDFPSNRAFEPLRLKSALLVLDYVFRSSETVFFGLGPGSTLTGNIGEPGILGTLSMDNPSFLITQYPGALADVGVLGLTLYSWMFFIVGKQILVSYFRNPSDFVLLTGIGVWVYYVLIGPQHGLAWRNPVVSYIFWLIASYAYSFKDEMVSNKIAVPKSKF
ncbi:MAG: hypothetical protein SRB2_04484 [Desulfobacteraceae bacterium Eth-SRB2]|nr:MAG: hypothetical protein SRB2_04484 [Desulfobacteraceae bacterium Eth-SRB2]